MYAYTVLLLLLLLLLLYVRIDGIVVAPLSHDAARRLREQCQGCLFYETPRGVPDNLAVVGGLMER